jgi:hypothetical protein
VAQVAKAAAAGQATGTAGKIVSGGVGEIAEAASEVPSKVRVGLLQLAPDQHDQGRITEFLGALTDPTPLAERADRLSAGVQAALDDATQRTAELIDESAKSAFETIDAAATATATRS